MRIVRRCRSAWGELGAGQRRSNDTGECDGRTPPLCFGRRHRSASNRRRWRRMNGSRAIAFLSWASLAATVTLRPLAAQRPLSDSVVADRVLRETLALLPSYNVGDHYSILGGIYP